MFSLGIEDFIQQCINEENMEMGTCKSFSSSKSPKKEAFSANFESQSTRVTPETDFKTPRSRWTLKILEC